MEEENRASELDAFFTLQFQMIMRIEKGKGQLRQVKVTLTIVTLYLVQTGFSKIEPVTCKILTFLPKNTGIREKTKHARGNYEKVNQVLLNLALISLYLV